MVNRAVSLWVAPLSFNLWTGSLWACQNAKIGDKTGLLAGHQQAAWSIGDQADVARIVICPAGKLSFQAYVAFQCATVETSFKALIEFLARVQVCVLKLMISKLLKEQKLWTCTVNYCYKNEPCFFFYAPLSCLTFLVRILNSLGQILSLFPWCVGQWGLIS